MNGSVQKCFFPLKKSVKNNVGEKSRTVENVPTNQKQELTIDDYVKLLGNVFRGIQRHMKTPLSVSHPMVGFDKDVRNISDI